MELRETVDMMCSEDYNERFKAEYYQLDDRIGKLSALVESYNNDMLDFEPKCSIELLLWQLSTMKEYKSILSRRAQIEGIHIDGVEDSSTTEELTMCRDCKNCKYFLTGSGVRGVCTEFGFTVKPDDYCAWAEKEES